MEDKGMKVNKEHKERKYGKSIDTRIKNMTKD